MYSTYNAPFLANLYRVPFFIITTFLLRPVVHHRHDCRHNVFDLLPSFVMFNLMSLILSLQRFRFPRILSLRIPGNGGNPRHISKYTRPPIQVKNAFSLLLLFGLLISPRFHILFISDFSVLLIRFHTSSYYMLHRT